MSLGLIQRIQMLEDRYNALYNNSKKIQELENATSIGADTQLLINKVGLNNSYELQRANYSLVAPDASATERGFINTVEQTFKGVKSFINMIWAKATPTNTVDTKLGAIGMGTDGVNPLFSFRIDTSGNMNLDKVYNSVFANVLSVNRENGNIGIGLNNPMEKFVVKGGKILSYNGLMFNGSGIGINHSTGTNVYFNNLIPPYKSEIHVKFNNNEVFTILNLGNVGIGTTSPLAKLDVNGSALINGIRIGDGNTNGAGITLKTPDGSKSYKISIDNSGAVISTLI